MDKFEHFFFGWDEEHRVAWRVDSRKGRSKKQKETTKDLEHPSKRDEDPFHMVACWPDGMRHSVAEVTTFMYDAMQKEDNKKPRGGPHWSATLEKTNSIITV